MPQLPAKLGNVRQVSILHACKHPNVVLMLGAWLGEEQLYMVVELLHTDLRRALDNATLQPYLRWDNRHAASLQPCFDRAALLLIVASQR